jgi:hypothetical protein
MDKPVFIKLLEYGEEVGLSGTNFDHIHSWAVQNNIFSNSGNIESELLLLRDLYFECFHKGSGSSEDLWVLKTEYYFRLIEYRELQESRTAARSANKNAMWAIGISVAAIIVSAVLTFTQLNTPATINKSDLNALIESNRENGIQRTVKLDNVQMAQILSAIGHEQSNSRTKKQQAADQGQEVSHHELINKYFEDE